MSAAPAFSIDGELSIFVATELRERLLAAMPPRGEWCIDLSGVCEVDGAGLQLLVAAAHEMRRRGGVLRMQDPSPQLGAVLDLVGIPHDDLLGGSRQLEVTHDA